MIQSRDFSIESSTIVKEAVKESNVLSAQQLQAVRLTDSKHSWACLSVCFHWDHKHWSRGSVLREEWIFRIEQYSLQTTCEDTAGESKWQTAFTSSNDTWNMEWSSTASQTSRRQHITPIKDAYHAGSSLSISLFFSFKFDPGTVLGKRHME